MAKISSKSHTIHYFSVGMNYAQCEELYLQHVKFIVVTSTEGKRIQLSKTNMRKFITPVGLHGKFKLIVDQNNKIVSINYLNE